MGFPQLNACALQVLTKRRNNIMRALHSLLKEIQQWAAAIPTPAPFFNGDSHNVTVIDPVKEPVVKNIDLAGAVEFRAVDGNAMLYDDNGR